MQCNVRKAPARMNLDEPRLSLSLFPRDPRAGIYIPRNGMFRFLQGRDAESAPMSTTSSLARPSTLLLLAIPGKGPLQSGKHDWNRTNASISGPKRHLKRKCRSPQARKLQLRSSPPPPSQNKMLTRPRALWWSTFAPHPTETTKFYPDQQLLLRTAVGQTLSPKTLYLSLAGLTWATGLNMGCCRTISSASRKISDGMRFSLRLT